MGASQSSNSIKLSSDFVSSVIFSQSQKAITDVNSIVQIQATNIDGDVNITGNTLTNNASVDFSSVLESLNSSEMKQQMAQNMSQIAKSMVKDINLGNVSSAISSVASVINETMTVSTNISQVCDVSINNSTQIQVDTVEGGVTISDNSLASALSVIQDCASKSVANSNVLQQADVALSQSSSASTSGISAWGFATIAGVVVLGIAIVVIGPTAIPLMVAGKNPKILGVFVILISVAFFVLWGSWTKKTVVTSIWSEPFSKCGENNVIQIGQTREDINSAEEAASECLKLDNCVGFDFEAQQQPGGPDTPWTQLEEGQYQTIFYSSIKNCNPKTDTAPVMKNRRVFVSIVPYTQKTYDSLDSPKTDDVWINTETADYQIISVNSFPVKIMQGVDRLDSVIIPGSINKNFVNKSTGVSLSADPDLFNFVITNGNQKSFVKGPGMALISKTPNCSGLVKTVRKDWALYAGIGLAIVGILISIFMKPKETAKKVAGEPKKEVKKIKKR
jgi:hypothetical protein